jgi:hypothetical protein
MYRGQVKMPRALLERLKRRVLDYIGKYPPTRIIENLSGAPYLNRWELYGNHPIFDIYLHQFLKSDDNRALHDHPGASAAIVLEGSYLEWFNADEQKRRTAGDIIFRRSTTAHRIEIDESGLPPITIFFRGPKVRDWGFHCANGWRHHRDFQIRGCEP